MAGRDRNERIEQVLQLLYWKDLGLTFRALRPALMRLEKAYRGIRNTNKRPFASFVS